MKGVLAGAIFISFWSALLFASTDVVPTDLEADPEFQYVVRVLQIESEHEAIEELKLRWSPLTELLAKVREPLTRFERLRASVEDSLKTTGVEMTVALVVAPFIGGILELGLGVHEKGLRVAPHIKLGLRPLVSKEGAISGLVGLFLMFRRYLASPKERTPHSVEAETKAGMVVLWNDRDGVKEMGMGPAIGGCKSKGPAFGWALPLFPGIPTTKAFMLRRLKKLLRNLVTDLHYLRLATAREKLDEFVRGLDWLSSELNDRMIYSGQPHLLELHPLWSVQNLFEPSLVARSLGGPCGRSLKSIADLQAPRELEFK